MDWLAHQENDLGDCFGLTDELIEPFDSTIIPSPLLHPHHFPITALIGANALEQALLPEGLENRLNTIFGYPLHDEAYISHACPRISVQVG